jgi:hypothetical protein
MMEAVRTSETSVYFNETTWRYIPEGSNLQITNKQIYMGLKLMSVVLTEYRRETFRDEEIEGV